MEEQPIAVMTVESSSIELVLPQTNHDDKKKNELVLDTDNNVVPKKKKSLSIFKVALMLFRRRSHKSNSAVDVASKGLWKRFIGSMRPLHLQSNRTPERTIVPSLPSTEPVVGFHVSPSIENFEDVKSSSSSIDDMSRYTSVTNLNELDQNENDDEAKANMNGGDEMIDAKAEMFIAQFYEQMRLQDSVVRYNEMIKKSIG